MSGRAIPLAAVAVLIGVAVVAFLPQLVPNGAGFGGWLAEVSDEQDADRGWSRLDDSVREHGYHGDLDAYLDEVAPVDWAALRLAAPVDVWSDDGFTRVSAELLSAPDTVPPFLFERRIVHAECDAGVRPVGIGVYEDRRPFGGNRFAGGGLTGGQARCNAAFVSGS